MMRMIPARLAVGLLALLLSVACSRGGKEAAAPAGGKRGAQPMPVDVSLVSGQQVEYLVSAVGSIEAFEIVQITARVPGAVERVLFREGQVVAAGQPLVEIEPERYRLLVEEASAALEKARAALAEAEAGLNRRDGANDRNPGLIAGEEVESWRTRVATAKAELRSREATLAQTVRNADDSRACAPFAGAIQTRDVQTGRYVQPGALLATLVRREPLLLRFQVPEGEASRLRPGLVARFQVRNQPGGGQARLVHVAESAREDTRMVDVTAEVLRPDPALRPGSFAEISVPVGSSANSPVIPQTAVRPSERGFLAYVIKNGKAQERVLELGLRTAEGLVEVRSGLAPAESLVVRGAEALRDGSAVRVGGGKPGGGPAGAKPGAGEKVKP
ncbi:MAG: efflux RND transporter periplasmic adaptor subunit [Candidatus Delongbacteria bacterium]